MIRRLMHVFALSEKGAKDFVKAVIWCFVCNISLMLTVGVVIGTIQYLMNALETGGDPMDQIWLFRLILLAVRDTGSWARPKMPNLDQDAL